MEQRVSLITLGVTDLERARAFYEGVIGWTAAPGPPGIAFFDLGGIVFSLYPHDDLARDTKAEAGNSGHGDYKGFALAHNVRTEDQVDAIFSRFNSVYVVEMNDGGVYGYGQLAGVLRARFADARIKGINKTAARRWKVSEIIERVKECRAEEPVTA